MKIEELIANLVCPLCKGKLEHIENELVCKVDRLAFPITDGIPCLIAEDARKLD